MEDFKDVLRAFIEEHWVLFENKCEEFDIDAEEVIESLSE